MTIRTILVPVDGSEASRPALQAAFTLGRDLGAYVCALHVNVDSKDAVPLLGEGMSAAIIEEMIQLSEKDSQERAAKAKAMFDEMCASMSMPLSERPPASEGASAELTNVTGHEDEVMALKGRLSDLIVQARPTEKSDASATMTINASLFETGRPVLMAPPSPPARIGHKIAVSWNGSAEASKAVAAAMPLIRKAHNVVVLTVESDKVPSGIAPELVDYFARHGVATEVKTLAASGSQVGEAVLAECKAMGADLLVMGAYTHSRMRQLILGGVTRHVLENAEIPVLMAH
ncbi:MAG: universal stress protein [Rhodospirillaceae bacterium]|nr:universal stress protein [Rhodospirillaceae bacterium]